MNIATVEDVAFLVIVLLNVVMFITTALYRCHRIVCTIDEVGFA